VILIFTGPSIIPTLIRKSLSTYNLLMKFLFVVKIFYLLLNPFYSLALVQVSDDFMNMAVVTVVMQSNQVITVS